jgi:hypothetical protein
MQLRLSSNLSSDRWPMRDHAPRLLLSNVPFDCTEDFLRKWVEDRGYEVLSVRLIQDAVSRTSPSFAHVQLPASTELNEAKQVLHGQILQGRLIDVRLAVTPPVVAQFDPPAGSHTSKRASA